MSSLMKNTDFVSLKKKILIYILMKDTDLVFVKGKKFKSEF